MKKGNVAGRGEKKAGASRRRERGGRKTKRGSPEVRSSSHLVKDRNGPARGRRQLPALTLPHQLERPLPSPASGLPTPANSSHRRQARPQHVLDLPARVSCPVFLQLTLTWETLTSIQRAAPSSIWPVVSGSGGAEGARPWPVEE
eukprot:767618-Hanusia_phi.AAC.1